MGKVSRRAQGTRLKQAGKERRKKERWVRRDTEAEGRKERETGDGKKGGDARD